jgi:hypothetical protein
MQIITRESQVGGFGGSGFRSDNLNDSLFDGEPIPREISPRSWLKEGVVHKTNVLTKTLTTTRFFAGPQVCITRDDIRRTTWVGVVEEHRLLLCEASGPRPNQFPAPRFERKAVADGDIWRYHLALNKHTGAVSIVWVSRSSGSHRLWLDGREVSTSSRAVDFPFLAFSQAAVGRIQTDAPKFGILTYKCRESGRLFWRRLSHGEIGPECTVEVGVTVGGASVGIAKDRVVMRVDQLRNGKLLPTLVESDDDGKSFNKARHVDLSGYEPGFNVVPGYTAPTIDKGYGIHVPVIATNGQESVALNYVLEKDILVEAIRVQGIRPRGGLEVFPSTVGSRQPYGNGVTDGHGLIMVLGTEGRLYSSNSSAGGVHFPESALLNHEMPKVAAFDASECYSSGLLANYVSMDYLYIEGDSRAQPISPLLHIETWDMPLPVPEAIARSNGSEVVVEVLKDADLECGKVVFGFDDPSVSITDIEIVSFRKAIVKTNHNSLAGKRISFDVQTLFHRHYGETLIGEGDTSA